MMSYRSNRKVIKTEAMVHTSLSLYFLMIILEHLQEAGGYRAEPVEMSHIWSRQKRTGGFGMQGTVFRERAT